MFTTESSHPAWNGPKRASMMLEMTLRGVPIGPREHIHRIVRRFNHTTYIRPDRKYGEGEDQGTTTPWAEITRDDYSAKYETATMTIAITLISDRYTGDGATGKEFELAPGELFDEIRNLLRILPTE